MRAGDLRHRVTIQQKTKEQDTYGGEKVTWADLAVVWASKAHNSSREYFSAQKINAETTDLFIIRYRSGITSDMRLIFGSNIYDIIGASDPDGRRIEIHLMCREVV